ncbi:hypothetical protein POL68_36770 [Stigmatella sp. ncwal1]|uniref:DUF4064 domain-containing protein n=1 Tax=Stigmatella ashevillensis TaxID=2995309 RepID=A0ABT5DNX3_9BACT|nr:hypothetical protein [Stigmatella ashevillena]MDC0714077.1 hypothetical protein [Stigmatella ashevillena]
MEYTSGTPGPPSGDAREKVNLPAILLMVTGGIGIAFALLGAVQSLTGGSAAQMDQLLSDPNIPEGLKTFAAASSKGGIFVNLLSLALNGLVFFGALKMKNLESYGLAMAASIIALIPCFGCYCIGIPVGIWSLITLNKPEVKGAFRPS